MANFAPERSASKGISAAGVTTRLDPTTKKGRFFENAQKKALDLFQEGTAQNLLHLKPIFLYTDT